jgi:hypothetical protein
MELWKYHGKEICVTLANGKIFKGIATDYMSEHDNNEGVASIGIGRHEIYENEITSIEILNSDISFAKAV